MLLRPLEARSDPGANIDLTPVIDMVFMMLIFFLVATTFHQAEREMSVALPAAGTGAPISAALRELVINVDAQGAIHVSGQRVEPDELHRIVAGRLSANPQQKVSIRGDRAAAYAHVVRVLDVCKSAGVSEPFLDTVNQTVE